MVPFSGFTNRVKRTKSYLCARHAPLLEKFTLIIFFFLQSPDSDWQKVDYLMEFGEWLFVNEYPVEDAVDQVNSTFLNLNGAKS